MDNDADEAIHYRRRAAGVGADVIALHQVPRGGGVDDGDPVFAVAGHHVACGRGRAANNVIGADNPYALPVGDALGAGRIGADVVAFQAIAAAGPDIDAGVGKAIDGQATHQAVACRKGDSLAIPGLAPVQLDQRATREAWLGGAVNGHRVGDVRQQRRGADRLHAAADAEGDGIRDAHAGVGIENGLAE